MKSTYALTILAAACLAASCSFHDPRAAQSDPVKPVALELKTSTPFRFVAYGDTRFHDPADYESANPAVRRALVAAIDKENPAFISIGGDIVYNGYDSKDWQDYDSETAVWREHKIPVYPALGNHDLHESRAVPAPSPSALANYFQRYPELQNSRFYSARAANTLMLALDSSLDETSGPQAQWLASQLDHLPSGVDFVFFVFHHPPYTSSSDNNKAAMGGGHSARSAEQALAKFLEERQQNTRARFIVFSGHVHNYEHFEHAGVTYFVTGGGGAHPYLILHPKDDLYQDNGENYHYLTIDVAANSAKVVMHKVVMKDGTPVWSVPDTVTITAPAAAKASAAADRK
ncbi:MAG TPA: metallophosphoesterase [Candidatus Acidoferrum sp.]